MSIILPFTEIFQVIGFTLVIGGNITLFFAYHKLGIYWAFPIDGSRKKEKLIKTGIYSKIRHPVYLSFNLLGIGLNFLLLDWILLTLYIIGAFGLYIQALNEEKVLTAYFSDEYVDYMRHTGRFFIKVNQKKENR
jgi:protein-S-isoprenylcysteine O-methyltransferase Ste14